MPRSMTRTRSSSVATGTSPPGLDGSTWGASARGSVGAAADIVRGTTGWEEESIVNAPLWRPTAFEMLGTSGSCGHPQIVEGLQSGIDSVGLQYGRECLEWRLRLICSTFCEMALRGEGRWSVRVVPVNSQAVGRSRTHKAMEWGWASSVGLENKGAPVAQLDRASDF